MITKTLTAMVACFVSLHLPLEGGGRTLKETNKYTVKSNDFCASSLQWRFIEVGRKFRCEKMIFFPLTTVQQEMDLEASNKS